GAAGQEIDQTSKTLGTPNQTIVLARSEGHGPRMAPAFEEMAGNVPFPELYPNKRAAEIAVFKTPNGGAGFSVGSMAGGGSLAEKSYENGASRLTSNVLSRFLEPAAPL